MTTTDRDREMSREVSRIMSKVSPEPNSGCWLWEGAYSGSGYSRVWFNGKMEAAHRVLWSIRRGRWPGAPLMHSCDVRCCVNPDHLREAPGQANQSDMAVKSRGTSGSLPYGVRRPRYPGGRYRAEVSYLGAPIHVGMFDTVDEAAEAAAHERLRLHSPLAKATIDGRSR
jgi:hypothetical protein